METQTGSQGSEAEITLAQLFDVLWDELRGTIGSAPTAALLRRAVALTRGTCTVFSEITIEKSGRYYIYSIPKSAEIGTGDPGQLRQFVDNVFTLLEELTGTVLVRHLRENALIKQLMETD